MSVALERRHRPGQRACRRASRQMAEPIACLILALQQNRSGVALSLDKLPTPWRLCRTPTSPEFKLKMAVDGWVRRWRSFAFRSATLNRPSNPRGRRFHGDQVPRPPGPRRTPASNGVEQSAELHLCSARRLPFGTTYVIHGSHGRPGLGDERLAVGRVPLPENGRGGRLHAGFLYTVPVIASAGPNQLFNLDTYMGLYDPAQPR